MNCKYPKDSEYEYLWERIYEQFAEEYETEVSPLFRAELDAWIMHGPEERDRAAEQKIDAQNRVYEQRWRREEILYRLWLDTKLRKDGKTFADIYKRSKPTVEGEF